MSVIEDDTGKLWTAALGAGAFKYDGKGKVGYPIKEGNGNTAIEVFAIYQDRRGVLWLGTHNGGAYRFNGETFEKFRHEHGRDHCRRRAVWGILSGRTRAKPCVLSAFLGPFSWWLMRQGCVVGPVVGAPFR
jgi:hypothetical protein